MQQHLTIVMYHYVRDLNRSRYPDIKGLTVEEFRHQIGYIKKYYDTITAEELMDAAQGTAKLPPNALLLTFDDGYIDHFTNVFPILDEEKLQGCFFPPAKCILENKVLDVNKIHFVLASVRDKEDLLQYIDRSIDENRTSFKLAAPASYRRKCGRANRYDSHEVSYIKRMLQHELPQPLRKRMIDELFDRYVSVDEKVFSKELYMDSDQIACMQRKGMYIGSHGFDHCRLDQLSQDEQMREIDLSLDFLQKIGSDTQRWIACYPHGACNDTLIALLRERKCQIGLISQVGLADLSKDNHFKLPRLDTNDLPKVSDQSPNQWTQQVF